MPLSRSVRRIAEAVGPGDAWWRACKKDLKWSGALGAHAVVQSHDPAQRGILEQWGRCRSPRKWRAMLASLAAFPNLPLSRERWAERVKEAMWRLWAEEYKEIPTRGSATLIREYLRMQPEPPRRPEAYLRCWPAWRLRALAHLRSGASELRCNTGRTDRVPALQRFCPTCQSTTEVEDNGHHLLDCLPLEDIRGAMWTALTSSLIAAGLVGQTTVHRIAQLSRTATVSVLLTRMPDGLLPEVAVWGTVACKRIAHVLVTWAVRWTTRMYRMRWSVLGEYAAAERRRLTAAGLRQGRGRARGTLVPIAGHPPAPVASFRGRGGEEDALDEAYVEILPWEFYGSDAES
jgi:hypothetical protein